MSRGVRHGASDHGAPRRIILRSGQVAARTTPAAGRRVRAVVTSDGIGGTGGFGGTVPLAMTSDGSGGTGCFGGAVPLGEGRSRVGAGPGSGWGTAGSGMMFPWQAEEGRAGGGFEAAGIHRVTAAARPGSRPGSFHQAPASPAGTRHRERHGHQRS